MSNYRHLVQINYTTVKNYIDWAICGLSKEKVTDAQYQLNQYKIQPNKLLLNKHKRHLIKQN